jgi:hypothetical protein
MYMAISLVADAPSDVAEHSRAADKNPIIQ